MNTPAKYTALSLIGGIIAGFSIATWQGHLASDYSKPDSFRRFHQRLSPDALFYPTFAMMENLALAHWQPGKTLVIIGGDSVLNGVGQTIDELWSTRLQEMLGNHYHVVNLSLRGSTLSEGAALVAESLTDRGYPVIYVGNISPRLSVEHAPAGLYGYLYWQGRFSGKIPYYPKRIAAIRSWMQALSPTQYDIHSERRINGWMEAHFRAQSLWLHIGYRHFFTVFSGLVSDKPWGARDLLADNERTAQPLSDRFHATLEQEMPRVRHLSANIASRDSDDQWHIGKTERLIAVDGINAAFKPTFRAHMLVILTRAGRFYYDHLTEDEKQRDTNIYRDYAQIWRDQGVTCVEVGGKDFDPIDNIDHVHISGSGGFKMARIVADTIKEMPINNIP